MKRRSHLREQLEYHERIHYLTDSSSIRRETMDSTWTALSSRKPHYIPGNRRVRSGGSEQIEDGKEDHNVLAVIRGEEERLDSKAKQELVEFVSHVFDHVAGKTVLAGYFHGREFAIDYIRQHEDPGGTAAGATA